MRVRRMALAATLLLLFPFASAADAGPIATLTVPRIHVDAGALDGELAGLVWTTPASRNLSGQVEEAPSQVDPNNPDPAAPQQWATGLAGDVVATELRVGEPGAIQVPWLTIEAGRARLQVYERPEVPKPGLGGIDDGARLMTDDNFTGFSVDAGPEGDEDLSRLVVMPMEGQGVAVARLEGALDATGVLEDPGTTKSQVAPEYPIDLSRTVLAEPTAGGDVVITGSFRVAFLAVDVPYESPDGNGTIETRRVDHGPAIAYGPTGTGDYTKREAILDLYDARLTLDGGKMHVRHALLATPSLSLEATGGKVGGDDATGQSVQAHGDLEAALVPDHESLQVTLGGQVDRLLVAGKEVPVPQAVAPGATAAPHWGGTLAFAVLLLAVPAVPAAHWAAGRRRFTKMDRALDRGEFQAALRLADRFTPWPGQRQDGVLAAAICLLGLGRPEEACERLESGRWSAGRRPMRDFLRARGHAALGQNDEATRALAASLLAEPSLIAQARTDPVLAALVEGSRDPATSQEAYA